MPAYWGLPCASHLRSSSNLSRSTDLLSWEFYRIVALPGSGAWVARKGGIDERAWQRRRFAKAAFTHVLAFSPGFLAPAERVGSPRIFVSHGTRDGWLPIERCSRRIVPQLERAGYEVRYREFDGATSSRGDRAQSRRLVHRNVRRASRPRADCEMYELSKERFFEVLRDAWRGDFPTPRPSKPL